MLFSTGAISILGLGFVLGLKHALDADHVIAVSTIVSERKGFWNSSLVGALWGLGHTASLLLVGMIVVFLNVQIPEHIALIMELCVAFMLIALGVNVLWKIMKGAILHVHTHHHDHHTHIHPHIHEHASAHEHQSLNHHLARIGKKPFFVGMVHGVAGSAALMLLVLTTISSRSLALLYIGLFGMGSVGGMFLMSALIGLPFSLTSKYIRLNKAIQTAAGVISVVFGVFLVWEIGFVEGLFL